MRSRLVPLLRCYFAPGHARRKSIPYFFGFVPISDFYDNYARRRRDQIWFIRTQRRLPAHSLPQCVRAQKQIAICNSLFCSAQERAFECAPRIARRDAPHYGGFIYMRARSEAAHRHSHQKARTNAHHTLSSVPGVAMRSVREQARP
jgi:hypothetical protein